MLQSSRIQFFEQCPEGYRNEILADLSARAAAMVHGIKDSEILEGALFPVVWGRFLDFVKTCSNNDVVDSDEGRRWSFPKDLPHRRWRGSHDRNRYRAPPTDLLHLYVLHTMGTR